MKSQLFSKVENWTMWICSTVTNTSTNSIGYVRKAVTGATQKRQFTGDIQSNPVGLRRPILLSIWEYEGATFYQNRLHDFSDSYNFNYCYQYEVSSKQHKINIIISHIQQTILLVIRGVSRQLKKFKDSTILALPVSTKMVVLLISHDGTVWWIRLPKNAGNAPAYVGTYT
jgi:hypothetical protein